MFSVNKVFILLFKKSMTIKIKIVVHVILMKFSFPPVLFLVSKMLTFESTSVWKNELNSLWYGSIRF